MSAALRSSPASTTPAGLPAKGVVVKASTWRMSRVRDSAAMVALLLTRRQAEPPHLRVQRLARDPEAARRLGLGHLLLQALADDRQFDARQHPLERLVGPRALAPAHPA